MGVQLNIKSAEAHELAHKLASATGETLTEAVTEALRLRLKQVTRPSREELIEKWIAIGKDNRARMKEPWLSGDHGDLLYDELGLPKW